MAKDFTSLPDMEVENRKKELTEKVAKAVKNVKVKSPAKTKQADVKSLESLGSEMDKLNFSKLRDRSKATQHQRRHLEEYKKALNSLDLQNDEKRGLLNKRKDEFKQKWQQKIDTDIDAYHSERRIKEKTEAKAAAGSKIDRAKLDLASWTAKNIKGPPSGEQKDLIDMKKRSIAGKYGVSEEELLPQDIAIDAPLTTGDSPPREGATQQPSMPASEGVQQTSPQISQYGLGGIQRGLEEQQKQFSGQVDQFQRMQQSAIGEQQRNINEARQAGSEIAAQEQQYMEDKQTFLDEQQVKMQDLETARQEKIKPIMDNIDQKRQELRDAEVDPDRYWGSRSGGQKTKLILGSVLMGIGQGMTGRDPTAGVKMIQNFIDNDIQLQKENIGRMGQDIDIQRGMLGDFRNQFSDERAAEAATRGMAYENFGVELEKIKANERNVQKQQDLNNLQAQLSQQSANAYKEAFQIENQNTVQSLKAQADIASRRSGIAGQNIQLSMQERAQQAAVMEARGKAAEEAKSVQVPGMVTTGEKEITKDDIKRITSGRVSTLKVIDKIDKLRKHIKKYGTEYASMLPGFESEASKLGFALARELHLELKNTKELGVLAGPDLGLIEALAGTDPNQFFTGDYMAQLDSLEDSTLNEWRDISKQHGFKDTEIGVTKQIGFEE